MNLSYQTIKKVVLVAVLAGICFMFGYMYLGDYVSSLFHFPAAQTAPAQGDMGSGGPPGPVMQEIAGLKERIKENPMDADAYSQLGDLYFEASMYSKALELYKKAVQINGDDISSRNNLAICYHLVGKDKEAFDQLATALKMSPQSQDLWITYGVINYETGNMKAARQSLQKAVRINPTSEAGAKAKKMLSDLTGTKK